MRKILLLLCIYCSTVKVNELYSQIVADTVYASDGEGGYIRVITFKNVSTNPFMPKSDTSTLLVTHTKLTDSSVAIRSRIETKQPNLVSGTNIKTVNGNSLVGSGDIEISGTAAWGSVTGTLANQTDLNNALNGKLANTSTAGVGTSPTASSTQTITHNLGRVPVIIRIYGYGSFTSNAAATATTSSIGVFNSSGNFCVYQRYGAAITTTQAGLSSNTFSILLATGGGSFISGVIQNVTSSQFDIVWSETGTATAQVYLWEAQ